MAASFLQYCAMCEKQIMNPSLSILYCSQACRRKDAAKPLSASILPTTTTTPHTSPAPSRSTSPKRAPFTGPSSTPTPSIRIPTEQHAHKPDLDPTEWKPKLPHRTTTPARQSEAYRYLASFHVVGGCGRSLDAAAAAAQQEPSLAAAARRPGLHGHSASVSNVPSLDSKASTAGSSAASSFDGGVEGYFATRPLTVRRDPVYAVGCGGRGAELVTPLVPVPVELVGCGGREVVVGGEEGEDLWGRKIVVLGKGGSGGAKGEGLAGLLAGKGA